ncbi:IS1 family transposase, partial [Enterobacter cloacae]
MASISISCPSCSATEGVVRNGKSTAGHQRYLCSHCRKTWQPQFMVKKMNHRFKHFLTMNIVFRSPVIAGSHAT